MVNLAVREPRLAKSVVPVNSLKDQASIALFFQYVNTTLVGDQIIVRDVTLFAVDRHLLAKTHTGTITGTGRYDSVSYQAQFRDSSKSGLSFELSPQDAFLTVMEAWEFATGRPTFGLDDNGNRVTCTAIVSEPFMFPVGLANTEALRDDPENINLARRIARDAETLWGTLAVDKNHVTVPDTSQTLSPDSALYQHAARLRNTDGSEFKLVDDLPDTRPAALTIHPDLIRLAHGNTAWG